MGNIKMTQPCDEHAAMTSALPLMTSVHLAATRGRVQGISAFAAGCVDGLAVRERSVDGSTVFMADTTDLSVTRNVPSYSNFKIAGGVRCSLPERPPV